MISRQAYEKESVIYSSDSCVQDQEDSKTEKHLTNEKIFIKIFSISVRDETILRVLPDTKPIVHQDFCPNWVDCSKFFQSWKAAARYAYDLFHAKLVSLIGKAFLKH